jgi:hypothetical protein
MVSGRSGSHAVRVQGGGQGRGVGARPDFVAVRFKEPALHSVRARVAGEAGLGNFAERYEIPKVPFTVIPVAQTATPRVERFARAAARLDASPEVARVAPVFIQGSTKVVPAHRVASTPKLQRCGAGSAGSVDTAGA